MAKVATGGYSCSGITLRRLKTRKAREDHKAKAKEAVKELAKRKASFAPEQKLRVASEFVEAIIREESMQNWEKAEAHLREAEAAYTEIGQAGLFALTFTIIPLRTRFNRGERSKELYEEIMEIAL